MYRPSRSTAASLAERSPAHLAPVMYEALWPDLARQVATIIRRPTAIRKVSAKSLPTIIRCVEDVGGVAAVVAALAVDRRQAASHIAAEYDAPVPIDDADGHPLDIITIIQSLAALHGGPNLRSAARDVSRRLDAERRNQMLQILTTKHEVNGLRTHSKDAITQELAVQAATGVIDISGAGTAVHLAILSCIPAEIGRFPSNMVADAVMSDGNTTQRHMTISALWRDANAAVLDALATRWRSGEGDVVRDDVGHLLAVYGRLTDDELADLAQRMDNRVMLVLPHLVPHQREIVLRALPYEQRLSNVDDILEVAGALSAWAVCDAVRRGGPHEVARWLDLTSTGALLTGELGTQVAVTILEHWSTGSIENLLQSLGGKTYSTARLDIAHLAVHAPAGRLLLRADGTLGHLARAHLYEAFGSEARQWDYLRGLLDSWNGSVGQLARAVAKMSRAR